MGVFVAAGLRWIETGSLQPRPSPLEAAAPEGLCAPCLQEAVRACGEALGTADAGEILLKLVRRLPSQFLAGVAAGIGLSGLIAAIVVGFAVARRDAGQPAFRSSYRCARPASRS